MSQKLSDALGEVMALVEKATPGRWYYVHGHGWCCKSEQSTYSLPVIRDASTWDGPPSDDEIAVRAAVNLLRQHGPALAAIVRAVDGNALEAAREDAERYRWLLDECYRWPAAGLCGEEDQDRPVAIWAHRSVGDDVCSAIDRARGVVS